MHKTLENLKSKIEVGSHIIKLIEQDVNVHTDNSNDPLPIEEVESLQNLATSLEGFARELGKALIDCRDHAVAQTEPAVLNELTPEQARMIDYLFMNNVTCGTFDSQWIVKTRQWQKHLGRKEVASQSHYSPLNEILRQAVAEGISLPEVA